MISLADSYFEDEIREGFYVPSVMKQCWGAQIEVLNEVDRVCRKHGLVYYAAWGTLLGALRHGGIIPWDDDFDITMRRKDFEKFMDVWKDELPEGFDVINFKTHPYHIYFVSNVVSKSRACFEKDHLEKFHGFPYISGIDIFVLDNMSKDEEYEHFRMKVADYIVRVADKIFDGSLSGAKAEAELRKIEKYIGYDIPRKLSGLDLRIKLYTAAEKWFAAVSDEDSEYATQIMPCGIDESEYKLSLEDLRETIELPFETGTIPVIASYRNMVNRCYGDFLYIYKDSGGHDYPFFEKQKEDLQKVLDFEIPEYKFSEQKMKRTALSKPTESYRTVSLEVCDEIIELSKNLDSLSGENFFDALGNIQQLAIDLGTYLEKIKGEGYITVKKLEDLCERLFECSQISENDNGANALKEVFDRIIEISFDVKRDILNRKEIVFMPFKAEYWATMEDEYRKAIKDPKTDVYVVPMPYYYKNYDGTLRDMQYDLGAYPKELNVINCDDFDFISHRPDQIVVQNPYDEHNSAISVPPALYSLNLRKYTDDVLYIPWFVTDEFDKKDARAYKNMKYYCCMPGVINADHVKVQSENIRELYIDKLCEFAGDSTRRIWEEKISVVEKNSLDVENNETMQKTLLYVPDLGTILINKERAISKMRSVLETIRNGVENNGLSFVWYEEPNITLHLERLAPDIYCDYVKIVDDFVKEGWGERDCINLTGDYQSYASEHIDELVKKCSAFYGDPGKMAHLFRNAKKPVMIQNYEI